MQNIYYKAKINVQEEKVLKNAQCVHCSYFILEKFAHEDKRVHKGLKMNEEPQSKI